MVATCSESGSNPSSRVLYLRLHLLPLEPLVGAILVVQLYPARKATAPSPWRQRSTKERTENEKEDEDAVEKKDEDWAHDCTIDIVSPHLGSCITRHTYLIGSLWRVLISSCESHRRCCGGENRRKHIAIYPHRPRVRILCHASCSSLTSGRIHNNILPKLPEQRS